VREEMFKELRKKLSETLAGAAHSEGPENEAAKREFRKYVRSRASEYEEMLNEVLMPHQRKRLGEIMFREKVKNLALNVSCSNLNIRRSFRRCSNYQRIRKPL
jgi:hypothetical protein